MSQFNYKHNKNLCKISKAAQTLGVSLATLRNWDNAGKITTIRTPGGMRLFDVSSVDPKAVLQYNQQDADCKARSVTSTVILYSRVSSSKQSKDGDLARQQQYVRSGVPDKYTGSSTEVLEFSDIGSGLNFKRPGLLRLLERVKQGGISAVVVASRDRLARFGFELVEWMCHQYGTHVVVLESEDTTPESELGKDLLSIVQVYCCRWNGKRRYSSTNKGTREEDIQKEKDQEINSTTGHPISEGDHEGIQTEVETQQ